MHYQISRNGQTYGPYTLEDLQRYLASGNVLPDDLGKSDGMPEWLPVSQILAGAAAPPPPALPASGFADAASAPVSSQPAYMQTPAYAPSALYGQPASQAALIAGAQYPEAPNLHWGLVLLFTVFTNGLFMIIWNLIIAAWLRRVQPNAKALFYYIAMLVTTFLMLIPIFTMIPQILAASNAGNSNFVPSLPLFSLLGLMGIATWVLKLIGRFSERASLEEHYNGPEPIGLRLSGVMTFFFGGLYFQYHLNRINEMKRAAAYGAPRAF